MFTKDDWDIHWKGCKTRFNKNHRAIWDVVGKYIGSDSRVLDMGVGPGVFYEQPPQMGLLVGIDQSVEGLRKSRAVYPSGIFLLGDINAIPIIDESFDVVLMFGILNYGMGPMKEAKRLCKKGGYICVTIVSPYRGDMWYDEEILEKLSIYGKVVELTTIGVWKVAVCAV